MKIVFRTLLTSTLIALLAVGVTPVRASNGDILTYTGSGGNNRVEVFRVDNVGSVYTTGVFNQTDQAGTVQGSISQGTLALKNSTSTIQFGNGTVVSTATTSGRSQGTFFTAYLGGTTAAVEGSLLIATTPVAGQGVSVIVAPAVNAQTGWIGVASAAVSTGSVVNVYTSGWVLVLTTGTVNAGDVLVSTQAAAGYMTAQNAPTTGTDVAVALGIGNANGGLTKARLR